MTGKILDGYFTEFEEIQDAGTSFLFRSFQEVYNYTFDPLHTYKVYLVYFLYEQIEYDGNRERNWESSPAFHLENPEEKSWRNGEASEAI